MGYSFIGRFTSALPALLMGYSLINRELLTSLFSKISRVIGEVRAGLCRKVCIEFQSRIIIEGQTRSFK